MSVVCLLSVLCEQCLSQHHACLSGVLFNIMRSIMRVYMFIRLYFHFLLMREYTYRCICAGLHISEKVRLIFVVCPSSFLGVRIRFPSSSNVRTFALLSLLALLCSTLLCIYSHLTSVPGLRNTPSDGTGPSFKHIMSPLCGFISLQSINKSFLPIFPRETGL